MKTKIKRHGRSVISVILAVCLLISCMTVGLIATDAANVTDSAIGAKEESEPVGYNGTGHVYTDAGSDYTGSISNNNQFSVTITVANENLSGNNLKIYVKAENDQFGNGEEITIGGSQCNLAKSKNGGILKDAGNYTTINVAVNFSGDVAQVTATGSGSGSGGGSDTFEVYIKGDLNGVKSWDSGAPLMTQDTTNPTRYYYLITSQAEETEYFKFYTRDGNNYKDYESQDWSNDTDLVGNNNTSYDDAYGAHEGTDRKAFKFSLNGTARIWFEPSTKKVWVETNPLVTITVQNNANVDTFTVTQGSTTISKGNNAQLTKGSTASVVVKMPATSGQKPDKARVGSTDITLTYNAANDEYRGSFTVPSSNATVSIPGFSDVEYYTIKYSADGFGTVSAQMGDTPIASGTVLREGSTVVFTATPKNEHYSFKSWSGSSTETATPLTMSFISSNITLKANFEPAKGTANTKYYFTWCEGDSQHINPNDWQTPVAVYLKDGHMYGYIDNVTTNKTYVYSLNDGSDKWHTYFYDNRDQDIKTTTSFGGSMDLYQDGNWNDHGNRKWGAAKITDSNVKGLIIDLGMYDPSNTSNTAYNVVYNVIPVFDTINKVSVYAKNGTLRGENHDVFASKTQTTVSVKHGNTTTAGTQQTRFQTASAVPGDQLVITTQITDTTMNSNYYVKAFSINGVVPQDKLFEESDGTGTNGNTFTYTYTIPADFKESYIEITPVYYLRANNNLNATTTMFYVENYDQAVEDAGWGNTLYVYPFYTANGNTDVFGADNAFGGYPGQPVIFHKGRRFVQIATTINLTQAYDTNASGKYAAGDTATIKGVTMNNGYWDTVHRDYVSEVYFNHQTYDYDDFYMIYRETTDKTKPEYTKTADEITFSFKYFTTSDNFNTSTGTDANKPSTQTSTTSGKTSYGNISNADDVFQNGWQDLKDYQGNLVDIFGNVLKGSAQTADPLWVISDGYVATHAGYYATVWAVYNTNKQYITDITPSALVLSSSDRFDNTTKYPSIGTHKDGYPYQKALSYYKTAYNTLNNANYKNRPVKITYEKSITNSAYEIGDRCDGRWTFSYYGALIESNIRIDYSTDGGATFTPDEWKAEGSNVGRVTGCSAYFTNTDIDIYGKTTTAGVSIRSNPDEEFTFSAQGAGGYVFAGWWLERDGIQTRITENDMLDGSAQRKSSDTYVAKFVQAPSGYCTVRHTVAEDSQGSGDTYVKIVAKKTGEADTVLTQGTDGFTANEFAINPDYIHYKSGYTFTITLKTVPNAYNNFTEFSADGKNDAAAYWSGETTTDSNGVATRSFDVSVDSLFSIQNGLPVQSMKTLDYYSTLNVANISYEINYNFTSRYYEDQTWQETGTFSGKDVGLYVDGDNVKKSFIDSKIPHESDFLKTITWNTDAATTIKSGTPDDVKFTVQVYSDKSEATPVYLKVTLPYEYEYAADKYFTPKLTDGKPTITETEDITLEAVYGQQYYYFDHDTKVEKIIEALDKYTVDGQEAPMVFKYWEITNKDNALVTKIYDRNLKIIAYGNYNATPVYMEKGSAKEIAETRTSLASTSINYIDSSRNQWNVAGKGSAGSSMNKADRLYADFALKYDYHNLLFRELKSSDEDPKIQTGMIIEVLGDLEDASNGIGKNTNLEYYRTKYAETGTDTTSITNLKKYIKGKSGYTGDGTASYNYDSNNKKISSVFVPLYTNKTDNVYTKPFTVNAENNQYNIDNRNGVHYTYGVANRKNNTLSELTNKNKIFRAYSYMIVNGEVYVSDAPTYFELYTEGSK